jgi:hypothetical protein
VNRLATVCFVGLAVAAATDAHSQSRPQDAPWTVIARATLTSSQNPTRVHNPACDDNNVVVPARVVGNAIASVMDQAIGSPVMELAKRQTPEIRHWLNEQFGLNDGRARCALLCGIIVPGTPVKVCGIDAVFGRACLPAARGTEEPKLGPQPYSYRWLGLCSGVSLAACAADRDRSDARAPAWRCWACDGVPQCPSASSAWKLAGGQWRTLRPSAGFAASGGQRVRRTVPCCTCRRRASNLLVCWL